MGLEPVAAREELCASTLSALRYPKGIDASLVRGILEHGVVVAGGLHPAIKDTYFRVGHMGHAVTQPEMLARAAGAVGAALADRGMHVDVKGVVERLRADLQGGAGEPPLHRAGRSV
jgi:alanine-glyoxylate transaminase/serine-glyoxylate transaminase/serine-pyruvate transaminase